MNTSRTQDGSCRPLFSRSPHPHLYSFLLLPMPVSQDKNEIMAYHRKQKTDLPSPSVSDRNKSPLMALHQESDLVLPGSPPLFLASDKKRGRSDCSSSFLYSSLFKTYSPVKKLCFVIAAHAAGSAPFKQDTAKFLHIQHFLPIAPF